MDQAWKSINGFTMSFTSSFEQLKTYVYTKIKNTEFSSLKTADHHREGLQASFKRQCLPRWSSR